MPRQASSETGSVPGRSWAGLLWAASFLGLVFLLGVTLIVFSLREGRSQLLWVALAVAGIFFWLEDRASRRRSLDIPASDRHPLLPAILVALVAVTVYSPTFSTYFLADDFGYVQLYSRPSWSRFFHLLRTDQSQGIWGYNAEEFRPLGGLSYMASYWLSGTHPASYHLVAVFQHVLSALAIFLIASQAAGLAPWGAAFAGLVFALLPVHSEAVAWINGSVVDGLPTMFYLGSFALFVCFRATGLARYWVLAVVAFVGSLLSKEIAVTLPLLLLCYDLFPKALPLTRKPREARAAPSSWWRAYFFPHLSFFAVLGVYLRVRQSIFQSYLRERNWDISVEQAFTNWPGFRSELGELLDTFFRLQEFAIRQGFLHFSPIAVGLALGLLLAWTLGQLRKRPVETGTWALTLYFGALWYLITSLPLLITYHSHRHFYLPAAGPCIAMACLAARRGDRSIRQPNYARWLGVFALLGALALLSWRQNLQWSRAGEISRKLQREFTAALEATPPETLVVLWAPPNHQDAFVWKWVLPFALQAPFTAADIYSQTRLLEFPDNFCCAVSQWWERKQPVLASVLEGPPDSSVEVHRLAWDEASGTVRRNRRVLSRESFRELIHSALGRPLEDAERVEYDEAQNLMRALMALTEGQ